MQSTQEAPAQASAQGHAPGLASAFAPAAPSTAAAAAVAPTGAAAAAAAAAAAPAAASPPGAGVPASVPAKAAPVQAEAAREADVDVASREARRAEPAPGVVFTAGAMGGPAAGTGVGAQANTPPSPPPAASEGPKFTFGAAPGAAGSWCWALVASLWGAMLLTGLKASGALTAMHMSVLCVVCACARTWR